MKVRTLIAGATVVLLCGGLGVCVAAEGTAPAPAATSEAAPPPAAKPRHHRRHHHAMHHGQKEFTEQELQQYLAAHPTPNQ
jgi:hypothetical protein